MCKTNKSNWTPLQHSEHAVGLAQLAVKLAQPSVGLTQQAVNLAQLAGHTPPEWVREPTVATREAVYYIFSGGPRRVQKYL